MHETAFTIGSLEIKWYGVLVALGLLTGIWTATRRAPRAGLKPEDVADATFWIVLGGIVGARALYVITYWREEFAGQPFWNVFAFRSGVVFYGGLIGATILGIVHLRRKRLPVWRFADVLAPSVALGHVFGRIGCLMTGCCFGRAADGLSWGVSFPAGAPASIHHASLHLVAPGAASLPVHPTQVYEALLNLALFGALAWRFRHRKFDGQVFALYLVGYAPLRAFVELFRGDYAPGKLFLGLTPGQLVSAGIFLAGAILYWKLRPARAQPPGDSEVPVTPRPASSTSQKT
ncbi:MAG: prolipoprotein diacylglyceryl transferase [Verrucomicrobia bacterium]|nr:prolipoprotein diacylglyceryl transferase [Verrucomicrobiota bacterium]